LRLSSSTAPLRRNDQAAQYELPLPVTTEIAARSTESVSRSEPHPASLAEKASGSEGSKSSGPHAYRAAHRDLKLPPKGVFPANETPVLSSAESLGGVRFLRLPQVKAVTGLSKTTLYALIREKSFPAPVRLGPRAVAWVKSEVRQWAEERVHSSRSAA